MGSVLAKNLVGYCGGVKEVFTKSKSFLKKAPGIGEHIASNITGFRDFGRAEEEADFISINNISYQFFLDKEYPFRLKNIPDCPIMIYKRGNADLSQNVALQSWALVKLPNMVGRLFLVLLKTWSHTARQLLVAWLMG